MAFLTNAPLILELVRSPAHKSHMQLKVIGDMVTTLVLGVMQRGHSAALTPCVHLLQRCVFTQRCLADAAQDDRLSAIPHVRPAVRAGRCDAAGIDRHGL